MFQTISCFKQYNVSNNKNDHANAQRRSGQSRKILGGDTDSHSIALHSLLHNEKHNRVGSCSTCPHDLRCVHIHVEVHGVSSE